MRHWCVAWVTCHPPHRDAPHRSKSDLGLSAYGGSVANLVLRDITLDGNTLEDSRRLDKERFVPMAGGGAGAGTRRVQVSFTYISWGKEFEGQEDYSGFGSLSIRDIF